MRPGHSTQPLPCGGVHAEAHPPGSARALQRRKAAVIFTCYVRKRYTLPAALSE